MLPPDFLKKLLLLTIFSAPLYLVKLSFFSVPTNVFEMLMILSVFLFMFNNEKKNFLKLPNTTMIHAGAALILLGTIFSIASNNNYPAGLGILKGWFLLPMIFSLVLYKNTNSESDIKNIFKAIFYSSAVVAVISLSYKLLGSLTFDDRLSSFYLSPNHLAMQLAPGFIFGLFFCMKSFAQKKCSLSLFINILLTTLIILALYYTYSYGAWVALLLSLLITFFISPSFKKHRLIVALFFIFSLTILFFSQIGTQKFFDLASFSQRSSLASRLTIWQVSLKLISENPIVGIGPGNFQEAYLSQQSNFPPYLEWAVPQPHNIFLAFWLQTGIIGLLGFLLLLFYIFSILWKILLHNKNAASLATPIFVFFLYTILHGLIDTTYWKNDLAFLFWINIFMVISLHRNNTSCKH